MPGVGKPPKPALNDVLIDIIFREIRSALDRLRELLRKTKKVV